MNRRARVTGLILMLAGATLGAGQSSPSSSAAQPPRPMFRTQVEYVEVDVLVSGGDGRFVSDLKKDDFVLREDGKTQPIRAFSMVNVPVDRVDVPLFVNRPIPADVTSNERPFEGRIYVLILDDLHVDASRSQRAKNAARKFIQENLAPNDLMAVMTVGGSEAATQEFTSNKDLLLSAVDNFIGTKLESATLARNNEYFMQLAVENRATLQRDTTISDPFELTRQFNARATLRTIRDVADWFGGVRGRRKSVLLVSEGLDVQVNQIITLGSAGTSSQIQSDNQGGSQMITDLLEAIGAAQRANVSLYTIDPRGLTALADETIAVSGFAQQNEQSVAAGTPQNFMARTIGPASMREELIRSQDDLRTLAEETGGTAAVNMNSFDAAFDRIVRDSSSYYVLAYYPPSEKRDGKFHKISVEVKKPGVVVRARNGYRSPRGSAPDPELPSGTRTMSPELRDSLSSPLPISGLTMHVFATPFRGTDDKASILLGVDAVGGNLNLSEKNTLELAYMALDTKRQLRAGSSDRLSLNLRPDTKARAQASGLRIMNRMDLAPGRYQLRVASHDSLGGSAGTVTWDLDVPDFNSEPLTMSGVVLTSVTASAWANGKADEQMRKVLPAQPTALRAFPQEDELALFAEVYDNRVITPHSVEIVSTVVSNEGRVLFKTQEERSSIEIAGGTTGAFGYTARVPLKDIPPGTYVLTVRARTSLNAGQAERQLQFRVVGAGPQASTPSAAPAAPAGAMRTVEKGEMSLADAARQVVVRSDAEWTTFWRQHAPNRPAPAVDFAREMVVGIFLGSRPTGGHSVEITGTRSDADALVVLYREKRPARDAITTQVITSPYHIVAIPGRPGTVRFEKVEA